MKRAVVTGATGFIGSHLVEELCAQGAEVYAVCRYRSGNAGRISGKNNVRLIECDADDYEKLPGLLSGIHEVDAFFHLAWDGASGPSRSDHLRQWSNVGYTMQAVEAAAAMGCKKIVITGTVYERLFDSILENAAYTPSGFYISSKRYAHAMAAQLAAKRGLPLVWCMFLHPIGPYIKPDQLMAYTIYGLLSGRPPEYGPARQPYDIISVQDLAYGLSLAGKVDLRDRDYYIGSGCPRPTFQYLEQTRDILQVDTPIRIGARPDDGLRFCAEWMNTDRFETETGFQPRVTFEESVLQTARWIQSECLC